jgi:hypothetical protein
MTGPVSGEDFMLDGVVVARDTWVTITGVGGSQGREFEFAREITVGEGASDRFIGVISRNILIVSSTFLHIGTLKCVLFACIPCEFLSNPRTTG